MDAFPAFFPLFGRTVVIAGSGEAADAKARLFEGSPANVVRVDGPQAFAPGAYKGAVLAFVAGDDLFVQSAAAAARLARVPVNAVDRPAHCDFTTPAVIDRGEVVAAVGTGGASPVLAGLLRGAVETRIPEGAGRVAALFREYQAEVREALPDLAQRRGFLRAALTGPAARAAMGGDMDEARVLFLEALAKGTAAAGVVQFVAGRGPVDLLTLRAARALAEADILIADETAAPEVLALARRDAERRDAADPAALAALAQEGLRVVRVITAAPEPKALKALKAAGVCVEVMLAAPG
jgi:precorrin-2 dehydrogenase/sirohydrochlorin ferrochelatase